MLKRIDIKLTEYWFGYDEYYVFYDDEHMTQEQAEKALEFIDWGQLGTRTYTVLSYCPSSKDTTLKRY